MDKQKWVVLTGGTGLLGRRLIQDFLAAGWHVAFVSHTESSQASVMESFGSSGKLLPLSLDLTAEAAHLRLAEQLADRGIRPEALVNNARSIDVLAYDEQGYMPRRHWMHSFLLDVVVAYELTISLANQPDTQLHSVVNVSSIYGMVAPTLGLYDDKAASPVNYGVTKAALIQLTKELAVRLADRRIRVNAVSFGGVEGRASEAFIQRYAAHCPQGRMLSLDDVAKPVLFLLSEGSGGMTGHNLVVDGGWTVW